MKYDNNYYENIIKKYNYKKINGFSNISKEEAQKRWISSFNFNSFVNGCKNKEKCFITMGIGINSIPHFGTIMQLLNIIYLQKKGFKTQIVLGDLDVYGARSSNLKDLTKLISKYKKFITALGYDQKKGIIRTQYERPDINQTAYLISNYIEDKDFYDIEEDINDLYKTKKVYEGMSFGVKQSIALMFADFIHPGYKDNYKHVLVLSGIDEHGYTWMANKIVKRMKLPMTISGLHTMMIPGLNKFPKMCKSLNGSTINVEMTKKDIKNIFLSTDEKTNQIIFELMNHVSPYSEKELNKIKKEYKENLKDWECEKRKYLNYIYEIMKKWK